LHFYSNIERECASIDSTVLTFKFVSRVCRSIPGNAAGPFVREIRCRSENIVFRHRRSRRRPVILVARKTSRVALVSWSTTLATINKTAPRIGFRCVSPAPRSRGFFFLCQLYCRSQSLILKLVHKNIAGKLCRETLRDFYSFKNLFI